MYVYDLLCIRNVSETFGDISSVLRSELVPRLIPLVLKKGKVKGQFAK